MDVSALATAFNEWMRRYLEEPERFARESAAVKEFLTDEAAGKVPSYGEECAVYITHLMAGG